MAIFNSYIDKLSRYVEDLKKQGRQASEFRCPSAVDEIVSGLPIRVGPSTGGGVILRSDTFTEMGSPDAGSVSFMLWTDDPSLLQDGRIALIGPDIPQSEDASLPFGQVLLVGGKGLTAEQHGELERSQHVGDQIEGYMIKSVPRRTWSRVSREAVAKGFNLETLGSALVAIYKSAVPDIEAMEVLFVTSGKEDLEPLQKIAEQAQEISENIVKETWKAKGYDIECFSTYDCDSCPDKVVCDDIKGIIKVRKKTKQAKSDGGSQGGKEITDG
jgi:CO dehydrogenase/acetyl-CoA synthase beta subunit